MCECPATPPILQFHFILVHLECVTHIQKKIWGYKFSWFLASLYATLNLHLHEYFWVNCLKMSEMVSKRLRPVPGSHNSVSGHRSHNRPHQIHKHMKAASERGETIQPFSSSRKKRNQLLVMKLCLGLIFS